MISVASCSPQRWSEWLNNNFWTCYVYILLWVHAWHSRRIYPSTFQNYLFSDGKKGLQNDLTLPFFFFCKPWTFYFVLGCSQLTKLWQFQVNREGTQPYICMNPFSPNLTSIQASTKHWVEFHVLSSRSLLVIHFKYSSVHVTFPNSLSLSPYSSFLKASTPTLRMMLRPWEKTQVHPRKSLSLLSACQINN